jgi:hypothetical protein
MPRAQVTAGEVLAGLSGLLSAEAVLDTLAPKETPATQAVPEVTEQARVFQQIVSPPLGSTAPTRAKKRSRFWPWLGRTVLYLLLIAVVGVTLYWQFVEEMGFFSEYNLPISDHSKAVFEQVNKLPGQAAVLVVFDYDPSLAGELNLQARALLQNLMRRKANILLLSTAPTGPEIAQHLADELAAQPEYGYKYGQNYLNLGYLPGQESSLLLFGQNPLAAVRVDFRDQQPLKDQPLVASLRDAPTTGLGAAVPLIINLSGTPEGLRSWIEQVTSRAKNIRMIAGVAGGAGPYAEPYLRSGQLTGLLIGLPGAAEYEALSQTPGRAVRSIDSQAGVHLLVVGLIVLGNLVYGVKHLVGRRRRVART